VFATSEFSFRRLPAGAPPSFCAERSTLSKESGRHTAVTPQKFLRQYDLQSICPQTIAAARLSPNRSKIAMRVLFRRTVQFGACWLLVASGLFASDAILQYGPLPPELTAVPQNLLGLIHTPEVQRELKLNGKQLADLESVLRQIDAVWWPSRILPVDQQRKVVAEQETVLIESVERQLGESAVHRLRQIELQSQSARILLRPEVAEFLRLDERQTKKINELFSQTDRLASDLKPDDAEKTGQLAAAKQNEPTQALAILTPVQTEKLRSSIGAAFDTTKLVRIYPFAPELIDSGHWTSPASLDFKSLRGKVVLLHFYAFQCHNCVANFRHYKRWDETLNEKGVALLGIQTPETSAEREPEQVISAAKKEGFEFPVLIDGESKNWKAWGNTMWPTVYVIDKRGYIRFWWQGELNWQGATTEKNIETMVDQLLQEP
jgi:peroxiredoxin